MGEFKKSVSQKLRLPNKDYKRAGWYFVTLSADYRRHLFGVVQRGVMAPNALGELVGRHWAALPTHYPRIRLGAYQVMPNHFHGLVYLKAFGNRSLGAIVNAYKGGVTREWRRMELARVGSRLSGKEPAAIKVWQPNYWEAICFDGEELAVKEAYVRANPARWALKGVPRGTVKRSRYLGNVGLLKAEPKMALRVSRKIRVEDKRIRNTSSFTLRRVRLVLRLWRAGVMLAGGCMSFPIEGDCAKTPRNLVLLFDGTWNKARTGGDDDQTNVEKLYRLLPDSYAKRSVHYEEGVGVEMQAEWGKSNCPERKARKSLRWGPKGTIFSGSGMTPGN